MWRMVSRFPTWLHGRQVDGRQVDCLSLALVAMVLVLPCLVTAGCRPQASNDHAVAAADDARGDEPVRIVPAEDLPAESSAADEGPEREGGAATALGESGMSPGRVPPIPHPLRPPSAAVSEVAGQPAEASRLAPSASPSEGAEGVATREVASRDVATPPSSPSAQTQALVDRLFQKPAQSTRPLESPASRSDIERLLATGIDEGGQQLGLDEAERKFLWDVEHYVLIFKDQGVSNFTNNIATFSESKLRQVLASDFVGMIPANEEEVAAQGEFGRVVRQHADEHELRQVDSEEFLRWLAEVRARVTFNAVPAAKFGFKHGAPVDHGDLNSAWHVDGTLRIVGESQLGQPAEIQMKIHMLLDQPTEDRLAAGYWLRSCVVEQVQVAASKQYLLQDVAADLGIVTSTMHDNWKSTEKLFHTGGVFLCDYNRDGCIDVLINDSDWGYKFAFYAGRPDGFFDDVTQQVGLSSIRGNAPVAFADLDNDGWEDLIVGPDQMFANQQGRKFTRVRKFIDVRAIAHVDSISLADVNRDGLIDVYLSRGSARDGATGSWLSGECPDGENRLLLNQGNWEFADVTVAANASGGPRSTFTSVWLDANDDGWPDAFVIHEFGDGVLLVNEQDGTFREQKLREDAIDFGQMGVSCGDVDNNGHVDIYVGQMYSKSGRRIISNLRPDAYPQPVMDKLNSLVAGSQLYRNSGDLQFGRVGQAMQVNAVGWAWGPAMADFNNDGFLDIYATAGFISRSRNKPDG